MPLLLFLCLFIDWEHCEDCEDCSLDLPLVVLIVERLDGSVFLDKNLFLSNILTLDDDISGDPFISLPDSTIGGVDVNGNEDKGDETEDEEEGEEETDEGTRADTQSGPFKLVVALAW